MDSDTDMAKRRMLSSIRARERQPCAGKPPPSPCSSKAAMTTHVMLLIQVSGDWRRRHGVGLICIMPHAGPERSGESAAGNSGARDGTARRYSSVSAVIDSVVTEQAAFRVVTVSQRRTHGETEKTRKHSSGLLLSVRCRPRSPLPPFPAMTLFKSEHRSPRPATALGQALTLLAVPPPHGPLTGWTANGLRVGAEPGVIGHCERVGTRGSVSTDLRSSRLPTERPRLAGALGGYSGSQEFLEPFRRDVLHHTQTKGTHDPAPRRGLGLKGCPPTGTSQ
ncbi:hypothetical protein SKAU_G00306990 [Synaphobranchus kaupii]|uniref:Uncharacterized protein n=1 Tax=Synaphobranchus kaupii TaxID=118154 RepID=A0A9Q1EQZ7_SYNKA|nr:hypothetical protein SKAU_G00306990 [Synaphobranchus kaupii]